MRRIVFLLIILAAIGGALWFFVFRPTPEKVLASAVNNLAEARGVSRVQAEVYWDRLSPTGQGFVQEGYVSYSGSLQANDLAHLEAKGYIGYNKRYSVEGYQSAEVVLTEKAAAFRLSDVNENVRSWFEMAAATGTTEETWYGFERDILLTNKGYKRWVSVGNGTDVRNALLAVPESGVATPKVVTERQDGSVRVMAVELDLNRDVVEQGLVSLISAWFLEEPDPVDLDWARRSASGAVNGTWTVEIDMRRKTFRSIYSSWPLYDKDGNVVGHVTARFDFRGFGPQERPTVPEDIVNVTDAIRVDLPGSLPSAEELPPPEEEEEAPEGTEEPAATSTEDTEAVPEEEPLPDEPSSDETPEDEQPEDGTTPEGGAENGEPSGDE